VWLPLPHLLILPFVASKSLWQNGAGGSLPSMVAYVLGVVGMFRLARAVSREGSVDGWTRVVSWSAAVIYGANPNLIYMQTTAMGESLYLAFFIWAMAHFVEFARAVEGDEAARSLTKCGWCLAGACLTRYDGWFLAGVMVVVVVIVGSRPRRVRDDKPARDAIPPLQTAQRWGTHVFKFVLIAAAAPALWLAYNAIVYRNPLEFANGPYSAKAIERNTGTVNPAKDKLSLAGSYFLKAAELNVAHEPWLGRLWLVLALLGSVVACLRCRGWTALLLWAPFPFYALSIAYGSVPIFVPVWPPFSHYNLRYGLQLLPAFALFIPLVFFWGMKKIVALTALQEPSFRKHWWAGPATIAAMLLVTAGSYGVIWHVEPICYLEATINSRSRLALETQLATVLRKMPPQATLLMYLGSHVGALERAGIPLRRVISEGNHRVWKQPVDPEGLWERALADPAGYADYVVAFEGDRVWEAVQGRHLTELVEIHTPGQARTVIYQGHAR